MYRDLDVLIGRRFGRLTVLIAARHSRYIYLLAACDCGRVTSSTLDNARRGNVGSCGCMRRDLAIARHTKHGGASKGNVAREYRIWIKMRGRCMNPKDSCYANYGGRGITMCDRWRESYAAFMGDMGPRPSLDYSVERINNDGPYSPENCRWATDREQSNNRRNNHRITLNGTTKTLVEWARSIGISTGTITRRLNLGWSPEHALTFPNSQGKKLPPTP